MELELDRIQLYGFDAVLDTALPREETLEMIVPDACPDILRVVDTDGKVLLSRREAMDGRAELSGAFKVSVLYVPDGESGLRHLDVTIPFTCAAEHKDITPGCCVVACARLCRGDTRAINPRKVLVRAEAVIDITVFSPRSDAICGRVLEAETLGVEQLTETQEVYLTACVQEKPFSCSDEVTLSVSKSAPAELLKSRVCLSRGDAKIIGNKLIFKGSANLSLLYRGEDDGLYTASAELPFSQIMEVSGVGEDAECELTLALAGIDCALNNGGEERLVTVNMEILAQAVVQELRVVEVLSDAYSTKEHLMAEWTSCAVEGRLDRGVRTQNVREVWEAVAPMREVVDCRAAVGAVERAREGEKLILSAQVEIQVLYLGEDGELCSANHPVTVPCALELPEDTLCFCQCEVVGDVYVSAAMGGIEARLSLDFRFCALSRRQLTSLSDLRPGEAPECDGEQPSLVLRMLEGGERLWDVAKAYGTTIGDIISANELEGEHAAAGRLLLIPRRR